MGSGARDRRALAAEGALSGSPQERVGFSPGGLSRCSKSSIRRSDYVSVIHPAGQLAAESRRGGATRLAPWAATAVHSGRELGNSPAT